MILSMTGYGKSESKSKSYTFCIDVKSINSRFIEVVTKLPSSIVQYDKEIIDLIKKQCKRGKVVLNVSITKNDDKKIILNKNKLNSILKLTSEIKKEAKIKTELSLSDIINIPDIYEQKINIQSSTNKKILLKSVKVALDDLNKFRVKEGKNILKDLNVKMSKINIDLKKIKRISKTTVSKEYKILNKKIQKIQNNINNLDNERIYQEIALAIERKDVNEEIIRLESHIDLFYNYMSAKDYTGKKMNFLLQEMLREVNTLGAKTDKIKVSHLVVNLKDNLEQIREQVQNIL